MYDLETLKNLWEIESYLIEMNESNNYIVKGSPILNCREEKIGEVIGIVKIKNKKIEFLQLKIAYPIFMKDIDVPLKHIYFKTKS